LYFIQKVAASLLLSDAYFQGAGDALETDAYRPVGGCGWVCLASVGRRFDVAVTIQTDRDQPVPPEPRGGPRPPEPEEASASFRARTTAAVPSDEQPG